MKSYKYKKFKKSQMVSVNTFEGERIETKIERITINNEPIKDGAPLVYRERNEGISQGSNIRTDRFEIAIEAMDKVSKSKVAKRENFDKINKNVVDNESTDTTN